jgi:hypothetical protein
LTNKRINDYGLEVEINAGIKNAAKLLGAEAATLVMLFGPTLFWVLLLCSLKSYSGLGILVGFKLRFFFNQLESRAFEKEAKRIQKEINLRSRALPSQSNSSSEDPSQTGPSTSK